MAVLGSAQLPETPAHRHFVGSLYVEDQVLDKGYLIQV